jgi:hypothetical protein
MMERMLSLVDAFLDEHLEEKASNDPDFKVLVEMTMEDLRAIVEMTKAARKEQTKEKDKTLARVNYIIGQNVGFVDGYYRALDDANDELSVYMAEWNDIEKNQDIISCFITLGEYLKDRRARMQSQIDVAVKEGYEEVSPATYILINGKKGD